MSAAALLSVFLIALLGGVHCLAMCSGIALAAERGTVAVRVVSRRRLWFEQVVMHAGRLTTYALLGAIMGAMGATFWR
ncbi:sulfite exporter TauE/SafE family protein, partial [Aeromonas veronii]